MAQNQASSAASDSNIQLSDITTNNVSTTKHGFQPKATNAGTGAMLDSGTYGPVTEARQSITDVTTGNLSTTAHGYTPKAPNDTTKFLRGDATWTTPTTTGAANNGVGTDESTTSTSYTNLATTGPAVTVTTGTVALVCITSGMYNASGNFVSFAVSGATTIAASDSYIIRNDSTTAIVVGACYVITGLTAGSNTFTMKYKNSGGATGHFFSRNIAVVPL